MYSAQWCRSRGGYTVAAGDPTISVLLHLSRWMACACDIVSGTVHRGKVHENTTKQKLSGTAVLLTMGLFSTSTVRVRPYSLEVRPQRTAMSNQAVHTWRVCCETQMSNALWCCQLCSDNRNCIGVMWRGVLDTHVTTEPSHSTTDDLFAPA